MTQCDAVDSVHISPYRLLRLMGKIIRALFKAPYLIFFQIGRIRLNCQLANVWICFKSELNTLHSH